MQCERCLSPAGELAEYRVSSEVLFDKVCRKCAAEARALGLTVKPLNDKGAAQASDHPIAA